MLKTASLYHINLVQTSRDAEKWRDEPMKSLMKSEKSTIYYYNPAYVPPRRAWWVETPILQWIGFPYMLISTT